MAIENDHNNIHNPYQVLGISQNATEHEIKKAYKSAALSHHPDRIKNADDLSKSQAEEKMAIINEAYEILKDPDRKRRYDHMQRFGAYANTRPTTSARSNSANRNARPSSRMAQSRAAPKPAPFAIPKPNQQGEASFRLPSGINPFEYIPKPEFHGGGGPETPSGFKFTFSSSNSRVVDSNSGTTTYNRNTSQYKGGWKETITETVTVQTSGNAVYKKIMKREETGSPVENFKNAIFGGISSFTKKCFDIA